MRLKDIIIADYERYYTKKYNFFRGVKAYLDTLSEYRILSYIITLRICSYLYKNKRKILIQPFKLRLRRLQLKFGIEISYKTEIGKGLRISHGYGIIIHPNTKIGKNFTILQGCTIGNNVNKSRDNVAEIGDNVSMGAGAKIIGPLKIGSNVTIGANAVVTHDIENNCVVAGVPAKKIK